MVLLFFLNKKNKKNGTFKPGGPGIQRVLPEFQPRRIRDTTVEPGMPLVGEEEKRQEAGAEVGRGEDECVTQGGRGGGGVCESLLKGACRTFILLLTPAVSMRNGTMYCVTCESVMGS